MTIETYRGGVSGVSCNTCPEQLENAEELNFQDFIAHIRTEKWQATKIGGEWVHQCPACASDISKVIPHQTQQPFKPGPAKPRKPGSR